MHKMDLQEPKNYIFSHDIWEAIQNAMYYSIFILEKMKYFNFNKNGLNSGKTINFRWKLFGSMGTYFMQ